MKQEVWIRDAKPVFTGIKELYAMIKGDVEATVEEIEAKLEELIPAVLALLEDAHEDIQAFIEMVADKIALKVTRLRMLEMLMSDVEPTRNDILNARNLSAALQNKEDPPPDPDPVPDPDVTQP